MQITAAVKRVFVPVTITLNSEVEVANLLGALIAYGTAKVYAENALKAVGLGEFYSGNVRKASRTFATELAKATEINQTGLAGLVEKYLGSYTFRSSHPSTAGAAVRGTSDDLALDREATNFEAGAEAAEEDNSVESNDSAFEEEFV